MTAVVGILNKHAVAVAADSAVTIGNSNNHKIFNKANKVFMLSKFHPVGIMIYNSASFMTTPWETIIKVYRKHLGKKWFPTLKDYQTDFIEFLRVKKFFTDEEMQRITLRNFALDFINSVLDDIASKNKELFSLNTEESKDKIIQLIENHIDEFIPLIQSQKKLCPEYMNLAFENFEDYIKKSFEEIIQYRFIKNGFELNNELILKIKLAVYNLLIVQEDYTNYTGLIFTGFGEDEIFPQLIPVNISFVADDRLRYFVNEDRVASISNDINGAVRPFAQTDVIDTILQGVDPSLDDIYSQNFGKTFQKYNNEIVEILKESNPELSQKISEIDTEIILRELQNMNYQIRREKYIFPLMNAVSSLSKEDLAEMAESLIYLTYLKRRITFAEESVGGPVDVAVISKGDGFVWIKRKHYFRPELNQHFIKNYFK